MVANLWLVPQLGRALLQEREGPQIFATFIKNPTQSVCDRRIIRQQLTRSFGKGEGAAQVGDGFRVNGGKIVQGRDKIGIYTQQFLVGIPGGSIILEALLQLPDLHQNHDVIGFRGDSIELVESLLWFVGRFVQLGDQQVRSCQIRLQIDGLKHGGFGLFGIVLRDRNGGKSNQGFMSRIVLQVLRIDETKGARQMNFSNEKP